MVTTPAYQTLANSSFLDLSSYQSNLTTLPTGTPVSSAKFNVALVLERAHSPDDLLNANWASRQAQIAELNQNGTLWKTYGADPDAYAQVIDQLHDLGIPVYADGNAPVNAQYVSSPESRTIWVQVDEESFTTLFGPDAALLEAKNALHERFAYWQGDLSLPKEMVDAEVVGLWFDTGDFGAPVLADPGTGPGVDLPAGPQGIGNASLTEAGEYPQAIAERYNFPLSGDLFGTVQTGTVGFVEPQYGTALPNHGDYAALLAAYLKQVGIDATPKVTGVASGGDSVPSGAERELDVGIAAAVNPLSPLVLYAGSGWANGAGSEVFTAYQSAIWDSVNNPAVVSSSFSSYNHVNPGAEGTPPSPFYLARYELFVDAVLRNITMINSAGDGGSGGEYPNGLPNMNGSHVNPFAIAVGGTSLSTVSSAAVDVTLSEIFDKALAHEPEVIWQLVSGGLKTLPTKSTSADTLIETVWNSYYVTDDNGKKYIANSDGEGGGYLQNEAGAGGVDTTQPQPSYQTAYGLDLVTSDPRALPGRGVPDVSALSAGNNHYVVPTTNFEKEDGAAIHFEGGTSASAPLWASLVTQINAVFADQKLPQLGYMNDLLYTAAVIAPAAFNDITVGDNTSSSYLGGSYLTSPPGDGKPTLAVTPTGYGYSATPGYDLVTGLGTPNGLLLARALTWIAHSQMSFADTPAVLEPDADRWKTTVKQNLLIQASVADKTRVVLDADGDILKFKSGASDKFAWTSRFAEQALQEDFDPKLVKLFDKQSQGAVVQDTIKGGKDLSVAIDKLEAGAPQATLSADYGFADFFSGSDAVRIARPVAIAETANGADDQAAVVRLRQVCKADISIKFFRVDDLSGKIHGLKPGSKGYAAAANKRAYETESGKTKVKGPGYGDYKQKQILDIDAGDIVAMKLKTGHHTYWSFANANEKAHGDHVGHLWNYGLNTWGWEAGYKGGDHDFNDLVVQLDFTSASGSEWLV